MAQIGKANCASCPALKPWPTSCTTSSVHWAPNLEGERCIQTAALAPERSPRKLVHALANRPVGRVPLRKCSALWTARPRPFSSPSWRGALRDDEANPATAAAGSVHAGAGRLLGGPATSARIVYDLGEQGGAVLILCEHPPTISVGRSGSRAHIGPDDETLQCLGNQGALGQSGRRMRASSARAARGLFRPAAG